MRQPIIVIGAGLAGLLAGNILRRHAVQIVERQTSLPNNHHAVLRFRTSRVADACHIPFREVEVFKACDEPDPIRAAMLYSKKVTGRYEVRSLINLAPCKRYIAPTDLIAQMAGSLDIAYGVDGLEYLRPDFRDPAIPIISTLPMHILMDALEYEGPRPSFQSVEGYTINVDIDDCDAYVTRYYAATRHDIYRASITGSRLIIEFVGSPADEDVTQSRLNGMAKAIAADLGITKDAVWNDAKLHSARYAKLARLSPEDRRKAQDFMFWASTNFNIYSLGRFATWRSGLLLDDVVDDVIKIEQWISGSIYNMKKDLRK